MRLDSRLRAVLQKEAGVAGYQDLIIICGHCAETGEFHAVAMRFEDYEAWNSGRKSIQEAFPYLQPEQREFLLTAISPKGWSRLFGKGERTADWKRVPPPLPRPERVVTIRKEREKWVLQNERGETLLDDVNKLRLTRRAQELGEALDICLVIEECES